MVNSILKLRSKSQLFIESEKIYRVMIIIVITLMGD